MNSQLKIISFSSAALLLSACGGGSGNSASTPSVPPTTAAVAQETAQGVFKDSNVAGMKYVSGSISGVTDELGRFTYIVGEKVKFYIGGIALGSALGREVITPLDLVEGGTPDTIKVSNMVRLFMLLDDDQIASNGISINEQVQAAAEKWEPIDLANTDLETQAAKILQSIELIYGSARTLGSAVDAKKHYESTLSCLYSGAFTGTREGEPYAFVINPSDGTMSGYTQQTIGIVKVPFEINNSSALVYKSKPELVFQNSMTATVSSVSVTVDADITAKFDTPNKISGSWTSLQIASALGGTALFEGTRLGNTGHVKHRISGLFSGQLKGAFEINFNGSKAATGYIFDMTEGKRYPVTGTLEGDVVQLTAENGWSFSGTVSPDLKILTGSWAGNGKAGQASGSGCVSDQVIVKDLCPLVGDEFGVSSSAFEASVNDFFLKGNRLAVPLSQALGSVIAADLGASSLVPGRLKRINASQLEIIPEPMSINVYACVPLIGSTCTVGSTGENPAAGDINADISMSNVQLDTSLKLGYSCANNTVHITGPYSATGSGSATVSAGFAGSFTFSTSMTGTGTVDATYHLQSSPVGGALLFKQ